ncbi:MAG: DUF1622 domain-containing protein, partial [Desulfuromonadales bacterium]
MVKPMAEWCAAIIETLGVGLITFFAIYSLLWGIIQRIRKRGPETASEIFHKVRERLGSGILLGLEFLVAADIIHTVAVDLSYESIGVLAIIVLIRTFLSFALEVELEGHWPW